MKPLMATFHFYNQQMRRGKAWKWFILLGLLPSLLIILTLSLAPGPGWGSGAKSFVFMEIVLNYFFKLYILLVPLFYATSVLSEEIDQQTIVFLFSLPIDRGKLLISKLAAALYRSLVLVGVGLLSALLLANHHQLNDPFTLKSVAIIWTTGLLATIAYSAFSFFLGVQLRRPMLIGLFFVFGWEQFVQYMPGFVQKISIIYFVKSTLPVALPDKASLLKLFQQSTSPLVAVIVLLFLSVGFCWLAMVRSRQKEFILSDS